MNTGKTVAILLIQLAASLALTVGCTKSISDRDLKLVDPNEALELMEGRKKLLGLAGIETGAWVDPRGARAYREGRTLRRSQCPRIRPRRPATQSNVQARLVPTLATGLCSDRLRTGFGGEHSP